MEFEILKTGKFLSSNGQEKEFSQTDLENIASSYDPAVSEAPLVIGHPKTNDPAYGWIENLKVTGDRLIAKAKQVVPEFLEAVKNGLFKKRSVSLTQDGKLRHVGFLGAELPAVKGLADLSFSETETDTTYEFSDIPSNSSVISKEPAGACPVRPVCGVCGEKSPDQAQISNSPVISTGGRNPMFSAVTSASHNKPKHFRVTNSDVFYKGKSYPEGSIVDFQDDHLNKYLVPIIDDDITKDDTVYDTALTPVSTYPPGCLCVISKPRVDRAGVMMR